MSRFLKSSSFAALVVLLAAPAGAQPWIVSPLMFRAYHGSIAAAKLPACNAGMRDIQLVVVDAASSASCTVAGGSTHLNCQCNGTTWVPMGGFNGPAATATALAANGANCSAGQAPLGVDASGAAEGCWTPSSSGIGGSTGSTDNALLRADGTGGATAQASGLIVDDVAANVCTAHTAAGVALAFAATAPTATTGASQAGKDASLTASDATASTDTAGAAAGGSVTITAGNAARLTSGNANGGNINLIPGTGIGTGVSGQVIPASGYGLIADTTNFGSTPTLRLSDESTGFKNISANGFFLKTSSIVGLQSDVTGLAVYNHDQTAYTAITGSTLSVYKSDKSKRKIHLYPDGPRLELSSDTAIGWGSADSVGGTVDTTIFRDGGSGIIAQRNGANAQTFRLYGTYTDASNYERLSLSTTAGSSVTISAETAGTGADNLSINLTPAGTGAVNINNLLHITPQASPPGSPLEGDVYSDTSHALCWYSGSAWVVIAGSGSCA